MNDRIYIWFDDAGGKGSSFFCGLEVVNAFKAYSKHLTMNITIAGTGRN